MKFQLFYFLSFKSATFSDTWTKSKMPHFQKRRKNIENYRPFKSADISRAALFGTGRSTTTNLVTMTKFITNGQIDVAYIDFKAFDKFDHGLLLHKLSNLGLT